MEYNTRENLRGIVFFHVFFSFSISSLNPPNHQNMFKVYPLSNYSTMISFTLFMGGLCYTLSNFCQSFEISIKKGKRDLWDVMSHPPNLQVWLNWTRSLLRAHMFILPCIKWAFCHCSSVTMLILKKNHSIRIRYYAYFQLDKHNSV